jgi:hypothetical protein
MYSVHIWYVNIYQPYTLPFPRVSNHLISNMDKLRIERVKTRQETGEVPAPPLQWTQCRTID